MTADKGRPIGEPGALQQVMATTANSVTRSSDRDIPPPRHGAVIAADARPWFDVDAWEQAIHRHVAARREFTTDQLQAENPELPDIGNAVGGLIRRLHEAGVIRRVGYRPSNRKSRSGGIVAIWGPGEHARAGT